MGYNGDKKGDISGCYSPLFHGKFMAESPIFSEPGGPGPSDRPRPRSPRSKPIRSRRSRVILMTGSTSQPMYVYVYIYIHSKINKGMYRHISIIVYGSL